MEFSTPLHTESSTKPPLRQAGGAGADSSCVRGVGRTGRSIAGSAATIAAFSSSSTPVRIGTAMIASRLPMASAMPPASAPRV